MYSGLDPHNENETGASHKQILFISWPKRIVRFEVEECTKHPIAKPQDHSQMCKSVILP